MNTTLPPGWPETPAAAIAVQKDLRHQVVIADDSTPPRTIAGVDVGYDMARNLGRASIVVIDAKTLQVLHQVLAYLPEGFPYVPGLLSFREIPVILNALQELPETPDLLMVDGHGIAHPRRLGIAAHLGVITGLPSIGVAKSLLTGKYEEPGMAKGDHSLLLDKGERIGTVLRSKDKVKPLFVSPGHRVGHETSVALVLQCLTRYRLPEPTRLADKFSKTIKQPLLF